MRWNSAHVGNVRQAPEEGQEVVNPDIKVPDEQNPLVEDEEVVGTPQRRDADAGVKSASKAGAPHDEPKHPDVTSGHPAASAHADAAPRADAKK